MVYQGAELREQILKWDRAQAKWFQWLGAAESPDVQPMEIDRIEGKGRGGKAKGKGKGDKGQPKGKSKGKNHANSYDHAGKGKGKSGQSQGKGKGGKAEKVYYVCNKPGHYAKDCWQNVRQVQSSVAGSSGQSDWTHVTSVSNQQPQTQSEPPSQASQSQPSKATQFRVSRISEQDSIVFDLRNSPQSSPKSNDGSIRVVHYFTGDDAELPVQPADIRAMVTEAPSDSDLQTILYSLTVEPMQPFFQLRLVGQVQRSLMKLLFCMMPRVLLSQLRTCVTWKFNF